MSIITISSIFNDDFNDYEDFCNNSVVANFIDTTTFETTLTTYIYMPIWLRYKDTPIKFSNDEKGQDAFLRNFYNQLSEVVFDFHNYAKENIEYFLYQNDVTKQGKPMSKTITSGIAPINQKIDQEVDKTNLASGTGSQFVSETVYNGIAWHKLVEGYFTPNRKTALLKAFQWLFISVYSPETKYNDKIGIKATVPLDMADGNQVIVPDKDYLTYDQVTVEKPDTMIPENILKDIDIGGVVGTYEPNLTEVTENSDLTQNQVITTPSGYDAMSKVTIVPPATAIPSNIKKDVNIGGVVGTYEPNILNYLDYQLDLTGDMDIDASDYNADGIKEVFIGIPTTAKAENIKQGVNIGGIVGTYSAPDTLHKRITTASEPYSYTDNTIVTMRDQSFSYDINITSFSSTSLTRLGYQNFYQCDNLTTVNAPNVTDLQTFGYNSANQTIGYCGNLTTVNLAGLKKTGYQMFYNCTNLSNITFTSLQSFSGSDFYNTGITQITTTTFPNLVYNAFSSAPAVFAYCSNLTSVDFSSSSISQTGSQTFTNCTSLQTAKFSTSLQTIGGSCFSYCTSLEHLYLPRTSVVSLGSTAFNNTTQLITVHVPSTLISAYQTASNWSTLYNNGRVTFVAI